VRPCEFHARSRAGVTVLVGLKANVVRKQLWEKSYEHNETSLPNERIRTFSYKEDR